MTIKKIQFFTISLFALVLILVSCSNGDNATGTEGITNPVQKSSSKSTPVDKAQPENGQAASSILKNGQTFHFGKIIFTIPRNWEKDSRTDVCYPSSSDKNIPLPPVSLHYGNIPLMPGNTLDNQVQSHIGTKPLKISELSICGYKGFVCQWKSYNHKHIGIFLEEKMGGNMGMIHFIKCQAPASSYNSHEETLKNIIASARCK